MFLLRVQQTLNSLVNMPSTHDLFGWATSMLTVVSGRKDIPLPNGHVTSRQPEIERPSVVTIRQSSFDALGANSRPNPNTAHPHSLSILANDGAVRECGLECLESRIGDPRVRNVKIRQTVDFLQVFEPGVSDPGA